MSKNCVCRLCGKAAYEMNGWLTRVNPKGEIGIWECRPMCGADLPMDERLFGALDIDAAPKKEST